jgi:hypothetical protein
VRTFLLIFLLTTTAIGQEGIPVGVGNGDLPPGLEGVSDLKVINQKRIECLQEAVDALQFRHEQGLDKINLLLAARIELAMAQLESTTVKKERLAHIESCLKSALLAWQMAGELQKVAARGSVVAAECQSRAAVFKYRAMWLKEKAKGEEGISLR